jgi:hypothetical protein
MVKVMKGIAIDKTLVEEIKKLGNQGPKNKKRCDSLEFAIDLKLIEMMTFHRYCLIIAQETILYVIDNV